MRTGCPLHRCLMMVSLLLPSKPPESTSALQPQASSASRLMLWAKEKTKSFKKTHKIISTHKNCYTILV